MPRYGLGGQAGISLTKHDDCHYLVVAQPDPTKAGYPWRWAEACLTVDQLVEVHELIGEYIATHDIAQTCPFCAGTGQVTYHERHGNGGGSNTTTPCHHCNTTTEEN